MKWPRMTTRQLMLAAAIVALSCRLVTRLPGRLVTRLTGIEGSPWGILGVLAALLGLCLAAALVFGLVLDLINAWLQPRPQPGENRDDCSDDATMDLARLSPGDDRDAKG